MDRQSKSRIINLMKECKTDDKYVEIMQELYLEEKIYAQCLWICRQYQFSSDDDKENKLKKIVSKYGIDIDKINEFIQTNLKHFDCDKHIKNIINLDGRLNREKLIKDRLEYVGKDAIEIVPIDNPSFYNGFGENANKFIEAYRHNYEIFHLNSVPLLDRSFGNFLNVNKTDKLNFNTNVIILSQRVVDKNLFSVTYQNLIEKFLSKEFILTKDLGESENIAKLNNIDDNGIVKMGSCVNDGDILISAIIERKEVEPTPEERLLRAIFGEKAGYRDAPFFNKLNDGKVVDINIDKQKLGTNYNFIINNFYNLEVGDVLGDINYNKGKIIEIISEKEMMDRFGGDFDLVTNFNLDDYVVRYNPIVKENLNYSFGESYGLMSHQPMNHNNVYKPLRTNRSIISKFERNKMLNPLSNIIKYSKFCDENNSIYTQIANKNSYEFVDNDIKRIKFIKNCLLGIGFRVEKSLVDNELTFIKMSDEEKCCLSNGEVVKLELINYRTHKPEFDGLLCPRIFGPVKDYECSCGKYKRIRHEGVICDKCGVEVTLKEVRFGRFGHISLALPVKSIFGGEINVVPILPPKQRPYEYFSNGRFAIDELNNVYRRIISRNNRVKKILEINAPEVFLRNEIKELFKAVNRYENYIIELIVKLIKNTVDGSTIIPSIAAICSIDNSVSSNTCLIPESALLKLFTPNMLYDKIDSALSLEVKSLLPDDIVSKTFSKMLEDCGIEETQEEKKASEEREIEISKENRKKELEQEQRKYILKKIKHKDKEIIKKLKSIIKNKKIVLFSDIEDGDIVCLNIGITKANSIIVNEGIYKKLQLHNEKVFGFLPVTIDMQNNFDCFSKSQQCKNSVCALEDNLIDYILKSDDDKANINRLIDLLNKDKSIKITSDLSNFVVKTIF